LKNAYVLGVGLAGGALQKLGGANEYGGSTWNMASSLFAQGTTEIARWLEIIGGTLKFAYGLPGAGDQYVTAQGGRTVRLGTLLGAGHTYDEARQIMAGETLESAEIVRNMGKALPRLTARGIVQPDEFPLMRTLIDIVVHGRPAQVPFDRFFGGPGRL
jgi:glycerol-3-phosphate dehydrogenase (NAD(P)+)